MSIQLRIAQILAGHTPETMGCFDADYEPRSCRCGEWSTHRTGSRSWEEHTAEAITTELGLKPCRECGMGADFVEGKVVPAAHRYVTAWEKTR